MAQKEDLQMESPSPHVLVEIWKIRVVGHGLKRGIPAEPRTQTFCQRGLPRADVARDDHEALSHLQHSL
jgi:hypothetical protein